MRIGFVAEPYEKDGFSGMGYMVLNLIQHLPSAGQQHEFTIYSSCSIDTRAISVPITNILVPKSLIGKLWWFFWTKEKIDVLLFIAPLLPLILPRRIKPVLICPELGSQKISPETFVGQAVAFLRDRILMPISLARAAHIISISQATKDDVVRYYHVPASKIDVIYVGFQDLSAYPKNSSAIDSSIKPYFFFTGRVKPRKNVHTIVSAFIKFKEKTKKECKLVIAGFSGGVYHSRMTEELSRHGLNDQVLFIGFQSPEMLSAYYRAAVAFVFPSLNEGFGMPVVEAMSLGTPVITSNISSLPEAAGDAGLLVDPNNVDDLSLAMEKIFHDEKLRATLIEKGYKQAQKFSWKTMGREIVDLVERITS